MKGLGWQKLSVIVSFYFLQIIYFKFYYQAFGFYFFPLSLLFVSLLVFAFFAWFFLYKIIVCRFFVFLLNGFLLGYSLLNFVYYWLFKLFYCLRDSIKCAFQRGAIPVPNRYCINTDVFQIDRWTIWDIEEVFPFRKLFFYSSRYFGAFFYGWIHYFYRFFLKDKFQRHCNLVSITDNDTISW